MPSNSQLCPLLGGQFIANEPFSPLFFSHLPHKLQVGSFFYYFNFGPYSFDF